MVKPIELKMDRERGRMRQGRRARYMARDRGDMGHSHMIRRRFSNGTTRLRNSRQSKPCYVGDNVYESISEAARTEGMKLEKLRCRLKRGQSTYQGKPIGFVELPPEVAARYYRHQTYEWEGETFDTLRGFARAVADTYGCAVVTVEVCMWKYGNIERLGGWHGSKGFAKRKTYHRATEKMATAPRKSPKAKFKPKAPPPPDMVPCSQIFFLGTDEFDAGRQVPPGLARIVESGGGVWKGAVVRVPQTDNALALYRELLD